MSRKLCLILLGIFVLTIAIGLFKKISFYKKTYESSRAVKLFEGGVLLKGEEPQKKCLRFDLESGFSPGYKIKSFLTEPCCPTQEAKSCLSVERESRLESVMRTNLIRLFTFYNRYLIYFVEK